VKFAFLHIRNTGNIGDLYSAPNHYFPFPDSAAFHLTDPVPPCDVAVYGGGALDALFAPDRNTLRRVKAKYRVAWGIGATLRGTNEHPPIPPGFDLIGVREWNRPGADYVPCVSCMHGFFDSVPAATRDIVLFVNGDTRIRMPRIADLPMLDNRASIDDTLAFLASGNTVVTNSYHGAYWATLMGRRVVCLPYSSKFHGYKHPPVMADDRNWRDALPAARAYPESLEDARAQNRAFHAKVMSLGT
jgi:hypothetical protein